MILAHPLDQPGGLPFSPFLLGCLAAVILWIVTTWKGSAREEGPGASTRPLGAWEGQLSSVAWATRAVAIALLLLAIVAGRAGSDQELDNLAPAFVIGFAWPALILLSALLGPIWRRLDPWDGLARLAVGNEDEQPDERPVLWAAIPTALWASFLYAFGDPLDPRAIGSVLAVYTISVMSGSLAFGRRRWMSEVEFFGIFLSWVARLRHRGLRGWAPPAGAEVILGILLGGSLFYAARLSTITASDDVADLPVVGSALSELIVAINDPTGGTPTRIAGLAICAGICSALLWFLRKRAASLGHGGSVILGAVPAVASVLVAVGIARSRLFTSVQLLPSLLGDPLGRGWDLLGTWGTPVDPNPLGTTGRIVLQAALIFAGHLWGAVLVRRTAPPGARTPATVWLSLSVVAGILAISGT